MGEIEKRLIDAFLSDKLFITSQVSIPEKFLFLNGKFTEYDHCYHEFDSVEVCKENSSDSLEQTIIDFLQDVEVVSKLGWKAFDLLDRA